jgi:uncharacterized membrane protein YsdA (DUF1294 family)
MRNVLCLAGLLVLPVTALIKSHVDWPLWSVYVLAMSVGSYALYAADKQRARENVWRISENRLHLIAVLGGWPGGFIAQRRLRHKCSKANFKVVFWIIVLAHQFASFDSLLEWRFLRAAISHFGAQ